MKVSIIDLAGNYETGPVLKDKKPQHIISYSEDDELDNSITEEEAEDGMLSKQAHGLFGMPIGKVDGNDSNRPRESYQDQDKEVAEKFDGSESNLDSEEAWPSANISRCNNKTINNPVETELDNFFDFLYSENTGNKRLKKDHKIGVNTTMRNEHLRKLASALETRGHVAKADEVLALTKTASKPRTEALQRAFKKARVALAQDTAWENLFQGTDATVVYDKSRLMLSQYDSSMTLRGKEFSEMTPAEKVESYDRGLAAMGRVKDLKWSSTDVAWKRFVGNLEQERNSRPYMASAPIFWTVVLKYAYKEFAAWEKAHNDIVDHYKAQVADNRKASHGEWKFSTKTATNENGDDITYEDATLTVTEATSSGTKYVTTWTMNYDEIWKEAEAANKNGYDHLKDIVEAFKSKKDDIGKDHPDVQKYMKAGQTKQTKKTSLVRGLEKFAASGKGAKGEWKTFEITTHGANKGKWKYKVKLKGKNNWTTNPDLYNNEAAANEAAKKAVKRTTYKAGDISSPEEGNLFREWVVQTKGGTADRDESLTSFQMSNGKKLDASGSHNNWYISEAWKLYGGKYPGKDWKNAESLVGDDDLPQEDDVQASSITDDILKEYILAEDEALRGSLKNREQVLKGVDADLNLDPNTKKLQDSAKANALATKLIGLGRWKPAIVDALKKDRKESGNEGLLMKLEFRASNRKDVAAQAEKARVEETAAAQAEKARVEDFVIAPGEGHDGRVGTQQLKVYSKNDAGNWVPTYKNYYKVNTLFYRKSDGKVFFMGNVTRNAHVAMEAGDALRMEQWVERTLLPIEERGPEAAPEGPSTPYLSSEEASLLAAKAGGGRNADDWYDYFDAMRQKDESMTEGQSNWNPANWFRDSRETEHEKFEEQRRMMQSKGLMGGQGGQGRGPAGPPPQEVSMGRRKTPAFQYRQQRQRGNP